jgi:hypothetical protein
MGRPYMIESFCKMRCPACREGAVFKNKHILPLNSCMDMVDNCGVCNERLQIETNNGGGINYALTIMLFFLNALWYWPLFGLSYKDNSFFLFLITSIVVVLIAQPWLLRYSRIIFLYFIVRYKGSPNK